MSTGDQANTSRDGSSEFLDRDPADALAEEIRQAVNEANARGKTSAHLSCFVFKIKLQS